MDSPEWVSPFFWPNPHGTKQDYWVFHNGAAFAESTHDDSLAVPMTKKKPLDKQWCMTSFQNLEGSGRSKWLGKVLQLRPQIQGS